MEAMTLFQLATALFSSILTVPRALLVTLHPLLQFSLTQLQISRDFNIVTGLDFVPVISLTTDFSEDQIAVSPILVLDMDYEQASLAAAKAQRRNEINLLQTSCLWHHSHLRCHISAMGLMHDAGPSRVPLPTPINPQTLSLILGSAQPRRQLTMTVGTCVLSDIVINSNVFYFRSKSSSDGFVTPRWIDDLDLGMGELWVGDD